jgi:hypothetical protein
MEKGGQRALREVLRARGGEARFRGELAGSDMRRGSRVDDLWTGSAAGGGILVEFSGCLASNWQMHITANLAAASKNRASESVARDRRDLGPRAAIGTRDAALLRSRVSCSS